MKTVRAVLREMDTERLLDTYVYDHPMYAFSGRANTKASH